MKMCGGQCIPQDQRCCNDQPFDKSVKECITCNGSDTLEDKGAKECRTCQGAQQLVNKATGPVCRTCNGHEFWGAQEDTCCGNLLYSRLWYPEQHYICCSQQMMYVEDPASRRAARGSVRTRPRRRRA